ncbi:6-carboxytetrahydropterin synthase [Prosthecochloris sp. HL-130-GSB]|jgi:6-pyruvoyltetrahydropterin/6-carboxytetrahydropterin synthase|uniref:6-carboxy-5,6,7,8-tetrahydropterin synthase n=1 Tax=Prosthecochloris aestuarii TaxID=1102 RepID=A0A831SQ98_PROAE|nr:6-carboxytetrahydropterin synthase [Prosthecochloris sp. HL-130-GSB]ARM31079.1 6-pyruvoyl tetrahydrobiopterin synthase [Prosthecochloris sp. HL-130-GSB]HED30899.1 6-carboxytetrahydropterin synthase [Prosthecochloris aestuarii]
MNDVLEKPRKVYVTRSVEFNAAHRLFNPSLSEEENHTVYGKCSNLYGHGHNYLAEITVSGIVDRETGFLIDMKELKMILEKEIMNRFDHKHLNFDVQELENTVPSTEVIAVTVWDILQDALQHYANKEIKLHEVRIHETRKNSVRYLGE